MTMLKRLVMRAVIAGALLGTLVAPVAAESRNREIVASAFDRWAAGGTGFFQEMLSPDVVWTIAGSGPVAGTYRGREAFLARAAAPLARRLASPIKPVVRNIWADGDHVIVHWDGSATARDGEPYRNSYLWVFRMQGGKVAEATAFLDLAAYDAVIRRIPLQD